MVSARVCLACTHEFVTDRTNKKYCSVLCRDRHHDRERYRTHHAQIRERQRVYREQHAESIAATDKAWRDKNAEKRRVKQQRYRALYPEKARETRRKWREANPDKVRANWYISYQRYRARKAQAAINDLSRAQWQEILAAYDHRCVYCGRKMQRLTMDHIIPLSKGGDHTASNVVPACRACNTKKSAGAPLVPVQPVLLLLAPVRKKRKPA
jgi:5-methylcytosine-specific restriction endonuclease McrA